MANWKLGLPKRKGRYLFAIRIQGTLDKYWVDVCAFDPKREKHPYEHNSFKDLQVAWKPVSPFNHKRFKELEGKEKRNVC